jgi:hypothetical protein
MNLSSELYNESPSGAREADAMEDRNDVFGVNQNRADTMEDKVTC